MSIHTVIITILYLFRIYIQPQEDLAVVQTLARETNHKDLKNLKDRKEASSLASPAWAV
jgi:hypothetical protein